eukprot:13101874-Alexandrium_andersonii.AAC.1
MEKRATRGFGSPCDEAASESVSSRPSAYRCTPEGAPGASPAARGPLSGGCRAVAEDAPDWLSLAAATKPTGDPEACAAGGTGADSWAPA